MHNSFREFHNSFILEFQHNDSTHYHCLHSRIAHFDDYSKKIDEQSTRASQQPVWEQQNRFTRIPQHSTQNTGHSTQHTDRTQSVAQHTGANDPTEIVRQLVCYALTIIRFSFPLLDVQIQVWINMAAYRGQTKRDLCKFICFCRFLWYIHFNTKSTGSGADYPNVDFPFWKLIPISFCRMLDYSYILWKVEWNKRIV